METEMILGIAHFAILVREYEEAVDYYCGKLGFVIIENTEMSTKRWIRLEAQGKKGSEILLTKAVNEEQRASIGKQAGGRVLFYLHTNNFESDYNLLCSKGVEFSEFPRDEDYGKVAVFKDLYGNRIDLIQFSSWKNVCTQ